MPEQLCHSVFISKVVFTQFRLSSRAFNRGSRKVKGLFAGRGSIKESGMGTPHTKRAEAGLMTWLMPRLVLPGGM